MKRTRLRATSSKRKTENTKRRALGEDGMPCDVREQLAGMLLFAGHPDAARQVRDRCDREAANWHERRKCSSGGSRLNRDNFVAACQPCNSLIEEWPIEAHAAGLVVREGDPEWEALSKRNDRFAA